MARKTFADKYNDLYQSIVKELNYQVYRKGVKSKHNSDKAIEITDNNFYFNLDGGRWLDEIQTNCIVDNEGCSYEFYSLPLDSLSLVCDYCKYNKKKITK